MSEKPKLTRGLWLKMKAERKQAFLDRSAMQGKFRKAQDIIAPRGKNGRSMNRELLAAHGISAPRKEDQP
ncbi:MAG: hypothetical protein LLG20_22755 [Acidobacteriales bacterium]|nr:hypothetical protein [Terriglobales bacterium]